MPMQHVRFDLLSRWIQPPSLWLGALGRPRAYAGCCVGYEAFAQPNSSSTVQPNSSSTAGAHALERVGVSDVEQASGVGMSSGACPDRTQDFAAQTTSTWNVLFSQFAPAVWRMVRSLGVPEGDVEDVCQDVFVVVYRKLGGFEGRSALHTWIYGIAVRVVADYRKRAHRRHEHLVAAPPECISIESPERTAAARQDLRFLDAILDTLPNERREVFVLYEIEQLSMREVAEVIGCPLQTAYSRHQAARAAIDRALQALDAGKALP